MGNHTKIIIIPPLLLTDEFIEYCNQYLEKQYTPESGWEAAPSFREVEGLLCGNFSYFPVAKFIEHLKQWFQVEPQYEPADEGEPDSKYARRLYIQTNVRWGIIQMLLQREHDDRFWLVNITKDRVKPFGHLGIKNW